MLSFLASALAVATGFSLISPGTFLDSLWALNRPAYSQFASLARIAGFFLLTAAVVATFTGLGLLKGRRWAWQLAVVIFAVNIAGDAFRLVTGSVIKGASGLAISTGFLVYLTRPNVRSHFKNAGE